MGKVLIVASVASMIGQFNMPNIKLLLEMGYEVEVACNWKDESSWTKEKILNLKGELDRLKIHYYQVNFTRQVLALPKHVNAFTELRKILVQNGPYVFIHCHTPIAGAIARAAAMVEKVKAVYTAHGFHFYKGAPIKNWIMYFPVEWICSFWTDVLITINKEDFAFAQKHLHAKRTEYVPGVGIDIKKFSPDVLSDEERTKKRLELGVKQDEKMLLSVGELIPRKNHELAIKALEHLDDPKIKYFICGQGELQEYLQRFIEESGLQDKVKLLGYRTDVSQLCDCADLFVFPSLQEGLPVALMEAIASKTPVICSSIRGNLELVEAGALFAPKNVSEIVEKIKEYLYVDKSWEIEKNYERLQRYDVTKVMNNLRDILGSEGGRTSD